MAAPYATERGPPRRPSDRSDAVSERSTLRLVVLAVLVVSLLGTLLARLFYLQLVTGDTYVQAAANNSLREVVTPAARGLIVDQVGRPLVANRSSLVVSVDRTELAKQSDDGVATLTRLAKTLGTTYDDIAQRLKDCGSTGAQPPPVCWNGSPFAPIPVAEDVSQDVALSIMERSIEYPGVSAGLKSVRQYPTPYGVNAAHLLGYLGPVSQDELSRQTSDTADAQRLRRSDLVGRAGIEDSYDAQLRGVPAITKLAVDKAQRVTGTVSTDDGTPGSNVVSTIDARLQAVVEQQLQAAIDCARAGCSPVDSTKQKHVADSGAAVVVDTTNGHILAMASYPSYDPNVWLGGISSKQYKDLTSPASGKPLTARAFQGLYAPGSTFKAITTTAAARSGFDLGGSYDCPSFYQAGNQQFQNHEGGAYGTISLERALEVSCNTVFYGIADSMWKRAGGLSATVTSADPIATAATNYGLGQRTGIDLPGEAAGQVSSRQYKQKVWDTKHDAWCASAAAGYPELRKTNKDKADEFTRLDRENCEEGYVWRVGDALNAAIGQGDTVVTPLQMAMAYAAIANGGTLYQPQVAKAVVSADGKAEPIAPVVKGRIDASKATMSFLNTALQATTTDGTGAPPFQGFPLGRIPVASKTGSAQATVDGSAVDSTAWFASFAPANQPRYAVVMMISQGGTGSGTAGPFVRNIYEALFGVRGNTIDPARSVLVGGAPAAALPAFAADGTPMTPETAAGQPMPTTLPSDQPVTPSPSKRAGRAARHRARPGPHRSRPPVPRPGRWRRWWPGAGRRQRPGMRSP
ncbi:MAG: penicillin-binding protein 2 [Actinomycetota bacterium]|nr:MAG: penicillin-binding protein 2 [Actinomycetota bacterium]